MNRNLVLLIALGVGGGLRAQPIDLPPAQTTGGLPVMEALARRATGRTFDVRDLAPQPFANLCWAAFGVNRADGRRTAPSASNRQEHEVYVLLKRGAYVYAAARHRLQPVVAEDLRACARRPAPVVLEYVADLAKWDSGSSESRKKVACIDSGFISENVYLYCASEGLATGYRGGFDGPTLAGRLGLRPTREIIAVQPVGYPAP